MRLVEVACAAVFVGRDGGGLALGAAPAEEEECEAEEESDERDDADDDAGDGAAGDFVG